MRKSGYTWQVKTLAVLIFILMLPCLATSAEKYKIGGLDGIDPDKEETYHSVLLALSGGGARGLAVIGIIKAFEEKGIKIEAVAGTSMGGIIGGLYAAGYTPDELDSISAELNFDNLFSNSPPRRSMFATQRFDRDRHLISVRFEGVKPVIPKALTAGQELTSLLTELTTKANYTCRSDFRKLDIPYLTISTDIISGNQIVLDSGSIADAMRATMAFPLAFTGVEKDNQLLMDGGMVTPIPVKLARTLTDKTDFVVAINTASRLLPKQDLNDPVDIANQVTTIMTADKLKKELAEADFVIEPPIDDFYSVDFVYKDSLIKIGYDYGLLMADSLISILKEKKEQKKYLINEITFANISNISIDTIEKRLYKKENTIDNIVQQLKQVALENNIFEIEFTVNYVDTATINLEIEAIETIPLESTALTFTGNSVFSTEQLISRFIGDASYLTSQQIKQGLENILALYHNNSYDLVNIKQIDFDSKQKTLNIIIDEAIIRRIDIEQNVITKDWFIRSLFPQSVGYPYSTERATQGIRNIYATNLFDRVSIEVEPVDDGLVVKINVEEKAPTQLRLGWHWDDEFESEEFAELMNDNIAGIGLTYILHGRYSQRNQKYRTEFKTDRIFSTLLTSSITVYHNRLDRNRYDINEEEIGTRFERKTGVDLLFGQQLSRLGLVSAGLSVQQVYYTDTTAGNTPIFTRFGLRTIKLESRLESFDRIPFTTSGNRHLFQIEFAGKYLGGDIEYTRFYTEHEAYIPLGEYVNWHPHLALGISRAGLPPTEQFYLGGIDSFIGFRTHQLTGDKMFLFSNELRFTLVYDFYLSMRYDLGEVYNSTDQIKLRNLRNAIGAYLSYDSPLGPFTFGYGIVNQDIDRVYLNIGLKF